MREASSFIESLAIPAFEGMRRALNGGESGFALSIEAISALHPALQKQVLRCALRQCLGSLRGIRVAHIEALLSLCRHSQSGNRIPLPRNAMAMRQFDELLLMNPAPESRNGFQYELDVPGNCHVPEARATFRAGFFGASEKSFAKDYAVQAFFDPSALQKSLIIRSRISGDRYGGSEHRKIKKMFIDRKIPLTERDTLPIVVSGDDVIWIPGFRPAKGYEARDPSQPSVFIEFNSDPV
jgi:tRNA(Ile)-lysidine synthase